MSYLVRLGWSHGNQELFTPEELVAYFDGSKLNPAAAAFDPIKLEWCNAHFIHEIPLTELAALTAPFVEQADLGSLSQERLEPLCAMFRERANTSWPWPKTSAPCWSMPRSLNTPKRTLSNI